MKTTIPLGWKSLTAKLHPPLPMSPRESARLLALLNASFKQQLDRHPASLPASEDHTDIHLRSILASPLLSGSRASKSNRKIHGRAQDLLERPMDIFTEQVATGSATLETATLCLKTHYNNCLASSNTSATAAMKASGAGTVVTEWLWSSGLEESGEFLRHRGFVSVLVKMLISESQQDQLLKWLRRLHLNACENQLPTSCESYKFLLLECIRSEIYVGNGLESATALFTKFAQGKHRSSAALNVVAHDLTMRLINHPKAAEVSNLVIESFMKTAKTFSCRTNSYLTALHDAYLAKDPNPKSALQFFHTVSIKHLSEMKPSKRLHMVLLGLKTAELCLDKGRQTEAVFVMDHLRSRFPLEIGLASYENLDLHKVKSNKEEEQSLRLLDKLAIA